MWAHLAPSHQVRDENALQEFQVTLLRLGAVVQRHLVAQFLRRLRIALTIAPLQRLVTGNNLLRHLSSAEGARQPEEQLASPPLNRRRELGAAAVAPEGQAFGAVEDRGSEALVLLRLDLELLGLRCDSGDHLGQLRGVPVGRSSHVVEGLHEGVMCFQPEPHNAGASFFVLFEHLRQ
eukprot:SAG11_NODE_12665_length_691_cov_1.711149_1_plen_177_part_10